MAQNTTQSNENKAPAARRTLTKNMKRRTRLTLIAALLIFAILVCVLFKWQLIDYEDLKARASDQQMADTVITANRGTIYDTNMNVLARSSTAWTISLSPVSIDEEDCEPIAAFLSELLDMDYQTLLDKCMESTQYAIVKRKVDQSVKDDIQNWAVENGVRGINFTEDSRRYYPYGNFLASVLGFVGTDNTGLSGLEAYYDDVLTGTAGRVLTARNASGGNVYYEYETYYEAEPGYSLVLTVDEVVQYYLEKYVEQAMEIHQVENYACGIVMDVNTGAILAMTTKPDFDPNEPLQIFDEQTSAEVEAISDREQYLAALGAAQSEQWTNHAISSLYEPGSVFKVVTASAALETGAVSLDSHFYCSGSAQVADGVVMHCWRWGGHGDQSFTQAVINSCNMAFIQIGQSLGANNFYSYFKAFGLTEKTGIDLPGEGSSLYYTDRQMGVVELASCSFGQSNAITPIQMITAVAAAANGGYLVEPYIVDKVIDEDGNIIESHDTVVRRQVISGSTSAMIDEVLEQVVSQSTSRNAYIKGYRIGGKTGTSEKLGGAAGEYIASFCGIAPADDPQIAVLLLFDTPRGSSYYGGTVAAPTAGNLFRSILPYLGIDPVYAGDELETADTAVPSVAGMSVSQATQTLQNRGFAVGAVYGQGETVVRQFPSGGMAAPRGSTVVLYTDDSADVTVNMPDLSGRSVSGAVAALQQAGLNVRTSGSTSSSAVVTAQSVSAGTAVAVGTVIDVDFTDFSITD